jgi:hypothetical protein
MRVILEDWRSKGHLESHRTSPEEIKDLLAVGERDLKQSRVAGLGSDWRFNIAYSSALAFAQAALAAAGYRTKGVGHHHWLIQSLAYTIRLSPEPIALLDAFRDKRNRAIYDQAGLVSDQEAREMQELAEQLRDAVYAWLKKSYPSLLKT